MKKTISIRNLRIRAKEIIEGVKKKRGSVIITQRRCPIALIVNYEEYQGILHTLDEMSYPDWQERLRKAEEESKKGKGITLEALMEKIAKKRKLKHDAL